MECSTLSLRSLRFSAGSDQSLSAPSWGVMVVREGSATWVDLVQTLPLEQGDVVIMVPGWRGCLKADPQQGLRVDYFSLCPEELMGVLSVADRLLFEGFRRRHGLAKIAAGNGAFAEMVQTLTSQLAEPGTIQHRCQLLQLLGPLLDTLRELQRTSEPPTAASHRVLEILSKLGDVDLQGISVEDLAQRCGCSRRHLTRLVRQRFGSSVVGLKTLLRLDRAAAMLQNRDVKVIEVAYTCGFNHAGAFSAKFKQRFGTTPARWRNAVLAGRSSGVTGRGTEVAGPPVPTSGKPGSPVHGLDPRRNAHATNSERGAVLPLAA